MDELSILASFVTVLENRNGIRVLMYFVGTVYTHIIGLHTVSDFYTHRVLISTVIRIDFKIQSTSTLILSCPVRGVYPFGAFQFVLFRFNRLSPVM